LQILHYIPTTTIIKKFKSVAFLYTYNEQTEKEYRKIVPFTIASTKQKIPWNKLNIGCERPLQGKL
jgi:hypothetical protein